MTDSQNNNFEVIKLCETIAANKYMAHKCIKIEIHKGFLSFSFHKWFVVNE